MKLKYFCIDAGQYGINVSPDTYRDHGLRMIRTSDLADGTLSPSGDGVYLDDCIPVAQTLREGDILLSRSGTIGRSYVVPTEAAGLTYAGFLVRFRPNSETDSRYLNYALMSRAVQDQIWAGSVTSTIQNFNADRYANLELPSAVYPEQRRIADFLDDRVGRIDRIISARRVVAGLLNDEFQSRRSQMVRGLHMGDGHSVGGWLGEIANGWSTRRLGSVARFYSGAGFPNDYQGNELGDIPFAKVSDLALADSRLRMKSAANKVSGDQLRQLGASVAPPETIVFPKVGAALLGNARAVLEKPMTFDNNVMGVRFLDLPVRYWIHLMSMIDMARISNPGPVPSVNRSAVSELQVPAAGVLHQDVIGKELDEHMAEAYRRVSILSASIDLLTEYKSSLITAAVSGELDVTTAGSGIPG